MIIRYQRVFIFLSACDAWQLSSTEPIVYNVGNPRIECREGDDFTGTCEDLQVCIDQGLCDHGQDPWESAICASYNEELRCFYQTDLRWTWGWDPNIHQIICDKGIDECSPNPCGENSYCYDFYVGYECECDYGFKYDEIEEKCVDINECEIGDFDCGLFQNCINTDGFYECECMEEYICFCDSKQEIDDEHSDCEGKPFPEVVCYDNHPKNTNNVTCLDINYCFDHGSCHEMNRTVAETSAICAHTNDNFLCIGPLECEKGFLPAVHFEGSNAISSCLNIDECAYNLDDCGGGSKCVDTDGSFECECSGKPSLPSDYSDQDAWDIFEQEFLYDSLYPQRYNQTTKTCQEYDHCASSPCTNGICSNTGSKTEPYFECS
ncbi:Oidioi.mRNA.OKI2018_I69.chr2.g4135.t1.cds [Oikopleura dioica]|uniref:Oidioi.mRNA.OKI2018_I69.chr2.g4135.t1.cds n=1 Tax=Oikopleura dioica TaxID=34765 RepID=A0ABN7T1U1_OIKDI|nr:Oidioi.mRNA.OKI2018_I69.chr2.g4135.t1.cds [Oikopleura dioica]